MSLSWNCEFCTFHHKVPSKRCSMCGKPYQSRASSALETAQTKALESNNLDVSTNIGQGTAPPIPVDINRSIISTEDQSFAAKPKDSNKIGNNLVQLLNDVPNKNQTKNGIDSNNVHHSTTTKRIISNPYATNKNRVLKAKISHISSKSSTSSSTHFISGSNNPTYHKPSYSEQNKQENMQNQGNKNKQQNLKNIQVEERDIVKKHMKQSEISSKITVEYGEKSESQSNKLQSGIQNQEQEQEIKFNQQLCEQNDQQIALDKSKLKPIRTLTMIPISPTASTTWIYPVNPKYPIRKYQLEITRKALFHNTLVSLPTGLGKTLIAAVVMYNYYRWYGNCANEEPNLPKHPHQGTGKIVFCAPTRPLVSQQMEACYNIVNIPNDHIAEISGKISPSIRKQLWNGTSSNTYQPRAKPSLFFCTPQTLMQDIINQICPTRQIVCIVLDEAHKAKGEYAYVKVIQELQQAGAIYRVLGLSATPGTNIQSIQQVIDNLLIEEIQVRLETDDDVKPYIHQKAWETIVVKQPPIVQQLEQQINHLIMPIVDRLRAQNALFCGHGLNNYTANRLTSLSPYAILKAKEEYHQISNKDFSLDGYFYALQTLIAWRNDLKVSGVGMIKAQMMRFMSLDEDSSNLNEKDSHQNKKPSKRIKGVLGKIIRGTEFQNLWKSILDATEQSQTQSQLTSPSPSTKQRRKRNLEKHNPKLKALSEILIQHFERANACDESSRAIVFSQWRDSVEEIVNALNINRPLLKPRKFIGQGSQTATGTIAALESKGKSKKRERKGKHSNRNSLHNSSLSKPYSSKSSETISTAGMKQREQQQVLQDFKKGTYNIIVCTSIGEEGLDIGEVDLIVNFDCLRSPIRMIQRTGRTGRKRNGRVICLVAEGQEEQRLRSSTHATKSLGRALKLVSSFRLKKIASMFPILPVMEMKEIVAKDKYRLSQIGGHTPAKERARRRKKATGEINDKDQTKLDFLDTNSWILSDEKETMRIKLFGKLPPKENTFSYQVIDGHKYLEFPKALRRKLTKARFRNVLLSKQNSRTESIEKRNSFRSKNLVGTGSSSMILRVIEQKLKVSSMSNINAANHSTINLQNEFKYEPQLNKKRNCNDNTTDSSDVTANEKYRSIMSAGMKSIFTDLSQIFGSRKRKNAQNEISMLPIATLRENYRHKRSITKSPLCVGIKDLFTQISLERIRISAPPFHNYLLQSSDSIYSADESTFSSNDSIDSCSENLDMADGTVNVFTTSKPRRAFGKDEKENIYEDYIHVVSNAKIMHGSKMQKECTDHDKVQTIEDTQCCGTHRTLNDLKNQNMDKLSQVELQNNTAYFSQAKSDECHKTLNEFSPSKGENSSPLAKNNNESMCQIQEKCTRVKSLNVGNVKPCLDLDVEKISDPSPMISSNIKLVSKKKEHNEVKSDHHGKIDASIKNTNKKINQTNNVATTNDMWSPSLHIGETGKYITGNVGESSQKFYLPTPPESSSSSCSDEEEKSDEIDLVELRNNLPLARMKTLIAEKLNDTTEKFENHTKVPIPSELQECKNAEVSKKCIKLESNCEENQKSADSDNHDFKDQTNFSTSRDKVSAQITHQMMTEKIFPISNEDSNHTKFFIVDDNNSLNDQSFQKENFSFHLPTQDSYSTEDDESVCDIKKIGRTSNMEKGNELNETSDEFSVAHDNLKNSNKRDYNKEVLSNSIPFSKKDDTVLHLMSHSVVSSEDKEVCLKHPLEAKTNDITDSPVMRKPASISKRKHGVILSDNSSEFTGLSPVTKNDFSPKISSQTTQRKCSQLPNDELLDTPLSIPNQNVSFKKKSSIFSMDIEKDASVVCDICKYPDSLETNPIIFCDGPLNNRSCNIAVHKFCYNVSSSLDDVEFWRCDTCEEIHKQLQDGRKTIAPNMQLEKQARCKICNHQDGAMKKTPSPENEWVHPFCIYFSPNYAPSEDKKLIGESDQLNKLMKISEIKSAQKNRCVICGEGGSFECSEPQCHASAHPFCALNDIASDKKWTLLRFHPSEADTNNKINDVVSKLKIRPKQIWKMFCYQHKESAQQIIQNYVPRKILCEQDKTFGYHDLCKDDILPQDRLSSLESESPDNDSRPKRKRLRKVKRSELIVLNDDALVEEKTRQVEKRRRIEARLEKRRRAIQNNKFLDTAADIDTDEDIDGDVEEEESISRIEHEEGLSNDSFINDTSQLGHSSQDSLEKADAKLAEGVMHRELDTKKNLEGLISTPILNRRMKKKKKEIEWDTPSPMTPRSRESLKGLGNMHFVRSVIEHHKKGGESTELEKEYNMLQLHGTQYAEDEDYYERVNKKSSLDDESETKANQTIIEILDPSERDNKNDQSPTDSYQDQTITSQMITSSDLSKNEMKIKENQTKSLKCIKNPYDSTPRQNPTSTMNSMNAKAVKNLANQQVSSETYQLTNTTNEIKERTSIFHSRSQKEQHLNIHNTTNLRTANPTASTNLIKSHRALENINSTLNEKSGKSQLSESQRAMIAAKRREALLRRQQKK